VQQQTQIMELQIAAITGRSYSSAGTSWATKLA
jgi:hypothetical protein